MVAMRCSACGRSLDPDARFCQHCGRPVGPEEGPVEPSGRDGARERKIATLLFADIVGFTSLGEACDPELVSSLVNEVFDRLARETRRHHGTVEKFAGDAMLAVFGVPAVHEDDPERAVRAALAMQATMETMRASADEDGPQLQLRIGIESGEVLVDRARASREGDLFVTGDAVNTAARLEASARPGSVVVGAATYAATREAMDYEALPKLELKGKAEPVAAWRVVAARPARDDRRALGLETPLVGRDEDLGRLQDAVREALEDDQPRLVTISGGAGVGKSRLVWELQRRLQRSSQPLNWRKGRCLADGDRAYGPIADLVKADAGIADDDGTDVARQRLARRLDELDLGAEVQLRAALEAVLGIGERDGGPGGELFEAWRRYLSAIAGEAPTVLVIEDIHWAEDDVLAFMEFLARWGRGPMAIVCLTRPELFERRAGWGRGVPDATAIALEPLGDAASAALIDSLLDDGLPPDLRAHVVERAEGNPLFAEETVRMLVDHGVLQRSDGRWRLVRPLAEVEIPASIQAILAARLDTLPAVEKRLAQDAAVIGRIFWDTLLAHLGGIDTEDTEEGLRGLRARDLVYPREPSSLAAATEFGFRHVLIRDVAYGSLPKRDRAHIHASIAAWLEERLADRIDEFAELVASHLVAALEYAEAVSTRGSTEQRGLREQAYRATQRAARRASSLGVVDRACRWQRATVDLAFALERSPHEIARLADEDAALHGVNRMNPDHVELYARVVDDLERQPGLTEADEQLVARLRSALAGAYVRALEPEIAQEIAREGIARLEPGGPTPGRARLHRMLGWACAAAEPESYAEAILHTEAALAEAQACGDHEEQRWALHDLALARQGPDLETTIGLLEQAQRLAVEADDRPLLLRCRSNLAGYRYSQGRPLASVLEASAACLQQARLESEGRSDWWASWAHAYYLWEAGDLDGALSLANEALGAAAAHASSLGAHFGLRAMIRRSRGEVAQAVPDEAAMEDDAAGPVDDREWSESVLARAWAAWSRDPHAAAASLEARLGGTDLSPADEADVAAALARMAFRLADDAQLERAISAFRRFEYSTQRWRLRVDALAAADGGVTLEPSAALLEENGYDRTALDLWMDGALMAARAGRESEALDRARAIIERTGLHPLIGPIPETRWLKAPP
jgi:class 3 adenylate cyclase